MDINQADVKVPKSITRFLCLAGLRAGLDKVADMLKSLADIENAKVKKWAVNVYGCEDIEIDYKQMVIRQSFPKELALTLNLTRQVLSADIDKLEMWIKQIGEAANGENAFIRDLALAKLSNPEMAQLLNDLVSIEDVSVMDEILSADVIQNSEHYPVLSFLASKMKERITLSDGQKQALEQAIAA